MAKSKNQTTYEFSDRDVLIDMLTSTKALSHIYGTFTQEASNSDLLKKIKTLSTEVADEQRTIFDTIFQKGWYSLEKEDASKITQALSTYEDYKNQIHK